MLLLHGAIHLLGSAKHWRWAAVPALGDTTLFALPTWLAGALWLLACVMLLAGAGLLLARQPVWALWAAVGVVLSQLMIVHHWPDAKWGTVANVLLLLPVVMGIGNWLLVQHSHQAARSQALAVATTAPPKQQALASLPLPVQAWLHRTGAAEATMPTAVEVIQSGELFMRNTWKPFRAHQVTQVLAPGFVWHVWVDFAPLLTVQGHDHYHRGEAQMRILLGGWLPVANDTRQQIAQGALVRWLAELCWYPQAARMPYLQWEALDTTSAKVTVRDGGLSATATFYFSPEGDLLRIVAPRPYDVGDGSFVIYDWEIRNSGFQQIGGLWLPTQSSITWKRPDGDFTWLKLHVEALQYEGSQNFPTEPNIP